MKLEGNAARLPQHDYRQALKSAVNWLGDRYLLAEPTPRRREETREYFSAASRPWLARPR